MSRMYVRIGNGRLCVPETWPVVGQQFRTVLKDVVREEDGTECDARIVFTNCTVELKKYYPTPQEFTAALLHEGTEGISQLLELEIPHKTICAVSELLTPVVMRLTEAQ